MGREQLKTMLYNDIPLLQGKKIYVWGTGQNARQYIEVFKQLESEKNIHIAGYCDNDPKKWGTTFQGKVVVAPKDLTNNENIGILICLGNAHTVDLIFQQTKEMGIEAYKMNEAFFKIYADKVLQCYDLLEDEESKAIYEHLIQCNIDLKDPKSDIVSDNQYFALPSFHQARTDEIFIDCGAYVGDTTEKYLWNNNGIFRKIIAFEPVERCAKAAQVRIDRLVKEWALSNDSIILYQSGLGEKTQKGLLHFEDNNPTATSIRESIEESKDSIRCDIVTIDDVLEDLKVSGSICIKADIEGYEYKMLMGAKHTIQDKKPRLAICIYHNPFDFCCIPLLIHSLNPEYHFAVRHHAYTLAETVLYAW